MGAYLCRWILDGVNHAITSLSTGNAGALVWAHRPGRELRYALELLNGDAVTAWLALPDDDRTVLAELLLERA